MLIENELEIARIRKKLKAFFDLDLYSDFLFLTFEEFSSKHGHYGFSFSDFMAVRFKAETAALAEICNFLPDNECYLILPLKNETNFYRMEKSRLAKFLEQNNVIDFVVFEIGMTWLLVYDRHRKLTGLGNYIKKKMRKNVNLRFGETKIEFLNSDKIESIKL